MKTYTNKMWLKELALQAGINDSHAKNSYFKTISENDDCYEVIQALVEWGVIHKNDKIDFGDELHFDFLVYTIVNLLSDAEYTYDEVNQKLFDEFNRYELYDTNLYHFKSGDVIDEVVALEILTNAIYKLNNQVFDKVAEIEYKTDQHTSIEDVEYLNLSDTFDINLDEVYIEDLHPLLEENSIYDETIYNRRSNHLLSKSFDYDGYRVAYSVNHNRFHFRVSKKTERGLSLYFDGDIYNLKSSYKFEMDKQKIKNAYFKLDYQTSEELGLEQSKLPRFYGDLSELKGETLFERLSKLLKPKSDLLDTSFTVCKIHVPIKEVPNAEIVLELKLNIYVGGKVEFAISSSHQNGFEIKDGHLRVINENNYDGDFIINANTSTTIALKATLSLLDTDLMDIKSRAGIKALAKTTIHLYDSDGRLYSKDTDLDYALVNDLINDQEAIYACVDLSLYWLLNITLNDEGTLAYTLGLRKNIDILDEDNQVFGNLSHIENGMFKEKCSYLNKTNLGVYEDIILKPERILLDTYSLVIKDESKDIIIKSIPNGYQMSDICYEIEDVKIIRIDKHKIYRINPGVTKVRIYTSDNKYEAYLNVLVSDGQN